MPDGTEQVIFAHGGQQYSVTVPTGMSDVEAHQWAMVNKPKFAALNLPSPAQKQAHAAARKPLDQATTFQDPRGAATREFSARNPNEKLKEHLKESAVVAGGLVGGELVAPLAAGAEEAAGASRILKWLLPRITRASGVGAGSGSAALATGSSPKEALTTGAKAAGTELGGETALAAGGKVVKAIGRTKVDPLRKINELLGVSRDEVFVGKTPASLDQFATNPARGVMKYGMDEAKLSKMNPLERHKAITDARDKAGKQLEEVLQRASAQPEGKLIPGQVGGAGGKTVNVQKVMDSVFKGTIPDKRLAKQTAERFRQILIKTNLQGKVLSQLTPMEARTLQRELDEFANFAPEGTAKTFRDVATAMRRGISAETRRVVPEVAPLDQDYSDLANAVDATRRQATDFARQTPESKLRKWLIKSAVKTATFGLPVP